MRTRSIIFVCFVLLLLPTWASRAVEPAHPSSILIQNGILVDGTGARRRPADVRILGDSIQDVGQLTPLPGEKVFDATGLVVAPGFIDTLSHADSGIMEDPLAETQIRQGITTAVVGHDGASNSPLKEWFSQVEKKHTALNFASFTGHGTVRHIAMHDDYKRISTPAELDTMCKLVEQDMQAGALGLSSGLEYDPGYYSDTDELIACSKVAAKYGGIYVSHVRDEGDKVFDAFRELIHIAEAAHIPANISHIKLAALPFWNRSNDVLRLLANARKRGLDITADVYPYNYWQSSITALISSRNWEDRKAWEKGLADVGGAGNVLVGCYRPDNTWAGKTLTQISESTHQDPISVVQEIVHTTQGRQDGDQDSENVVVTAMTDSDVRNFVRDAHIMICSDGSMDDTHPRGAGTFPRVLGLYVRELHTLTLEQAVHKMTGLSAARMGFSDRGRVAPGMKADLTLFNPWTVHDTATTENPSAAPEGIPYVFVNGRLVFEKGRFTGAKPGVVLRHVRVLGY
jgi:N-acyl-D-amino-acid deacylase